MSYKLFLDDERMPVNPAEWIIVRSFEEACKYVIDNGFPYYVSFDHDLGTDKTGYDFAKFLIECDLNKNWLDNCPNFDYFVHSQNPVGKSNIVNLLDNYLKKREI